MTSNSYKHPAEVMDFAHEQGIHPNIAALILKEEKGDRQKAVEAVLRMKGK